MLKRRRFRQTKSLQDRLAAWAEEVREQAARLPPGPERDALLKKLRQADTAAHLNDWANSPGLQPPT
jgi:leucyl aminopeptidase